jgi:type IV pilus assembly protein PilA
MLQRLRGRVDQTDEGFTLIELMVVVLIIAILLAIAIPTFLGARARAQDRAAQSNLRNTATAEKTFYTDALAYSALSAELVNIEPAITYVNQTSTPVILGTSGQVGVSTDTANSATATTVCLIVHSASGTDFEIVDVATGAAGQPGTWYFGTSVPIPAANTACSAATAVTGASKF